jgi:hypothetical protein
MVKIPYDATKSSLYDPGEADNFFQFCSGQSVTDEVLCAKMSRLAYVTISIVKDAFM